MERMQKRGHCQGCGRVQAANPMLALHGYRVDCGYFHGVCHGAKKLPLEKDRRYLDELIVVIGKRADEDEDRALRLEQREEDPPGKIERKCIGRAGGRWQYEEVHTPYAELKDYEKAEVRRQLVWRLRNQARHGRRWIEDMRALAEKVHGQPLQEVKVAAPNAPIPAGEQRRGNGAVFTARYQERGRVYYDYERADRKGRAWMGTQAWRRMELVGAEGGA